MNTTACPDDVLLRRFLLGEALEANVDPGELEAHFADCPACLKRAETLAAEDTLTSAIHGKDTALFVADAHLQALIAKGKELPRDENATNIGTVHSGSDTVPGSGTVDLSFLARAESPDEIGSLGGYRVKSVLGVGGMGIVLLAEDPQLRRLVALKVMKPAIAAQPGARERFLREARAAASLSHDRIITIHHVGEVDGVPFVAMPYLSGESLATRLKRERTLPIDEALRITRQTALGLQAAHAKGLLHRDIKPDNIWLEGETGRVKVLDFGLAREIEGDSNLTHSNAILGTPSYIAPEQARGEAVDARCDLFSLGATLYEMVTGVRPFQRKIVLATLSAIANETPPTPRTLREQVPSALSDLVMRLVAKHPDDRPRSTADVLSALERIERGLEHGTDSVEPSAKARNRKLPSNRTRLIAAAFVLVGLVMAATIIIRFKTPTGEWVLEMYDRDVRVVVRQAQRVVEDLEVSPGEEGTVNLYVGEYQVEIIGTSDEITIESGTVTVSRDGEVIASLREVQPIAETETSPSAQTVETDETFALQFDGIDDYVEVTNLPSEFPAPWTMECWVYEMGFHDDALHGQILHRIADDAMADLMILRGGPEGATHLRSGWPEGEDWRHIDTIPDHTNGPMHVAWVAEPGETRLYVNGKVAGRETFTGGYAWAGGSRLCIGCFADLTHNRWFRGRVDEIRISTTTRYVEDFQPQARFTRDEHTQVLFHCDEGSGQVLLDDSGNSHHGRVIGAAWLPVNAPAAVLDE